ncbi:hypothetical protein COMA1_40237 [Candidatus Nitrospira nitrosa]|uniref:Uncharacterized protein n=1 Tax=Candidatus Nitrospira nitrosa TaxID=1742972 RepID=A0A0S4LM14_9BACT|nr:hypothetical protein COMA1_40237 [Candidatus Nitrospira nitrosa]
MDVERHDNVYGKSPDEHSELRALAGLLKHDGGDLDTSSSWVPQDVMAGRSAM